MFLFLEYLYIPTYFVFFLEYIRIHIFTYIRCFARGISVFLFLEYIYVYRFFFWEVYIFFRDAGANIGLLF